MRVLVVDDEAPARSELLHLLGAHEGVAADEAPGAAEALARVRDASYDAIFLDIEMPGLTGLDAAALVRAGSSPPAVVFVTAHAEYAVEAFAVEAFDYLLKPVDPERLARVVERLRERGAGDAPAAAQDPRRRGRPHRADRRRAGALRAGRRRLLPRPHLRPRRTSRR